MKGKKVYNMMFPLGLALFLPPLLILFLTGNFAIDSIVLLVCYYAFKIYYKEGHELFYFYRKHIIKVWLFGFLADFLGALAIAVITLIIVPLISLTGVFSGTYDATGSNILTYSILIAGMLLASFMIYIFGYHITFKKLTDQRLRFKISLTIALVTMPWTFLLQSYDYAKNLI